MLFLALLLWSSAFAATLSCWEGTVPSLRIFFLGIQALGLIVLFLFFRHPGIEIDVSRRNKSSLIGLVGTAFLSGSVVLEAAYLFLGTHSGVLDLGDLLLGYFPVLMRFLGYGILAIALSELSVVTSGAFGAFFLALSSVTEALDNPLLAAGHEMISPFALLMHWSPLPLFALGWVLIFVFYARVTRGMEFFADLEH